MKSAKSRGTPRKARSASPTKKTSAADPQEKAAKLKKKSQDQIAALEKDFLARLQHLRSVAQEISRVYLANLEHDILEIVDFVNGVGEESSKRKSIKTSTLEQMMTIVEGISPKPQKGRRKDLKKIEEIVKVMMQAASSKKKVSN